MSLLHIFKKHKSEPDLFQEHIELDKNDDFNSINTPLIYEDFYGIDPDDRNDNGIDDLYEHEDYDFEIEQ